MSRHVLLTGFEPFGPHPVNPSELLVRSLEGRIIGGCVIDARVLPAETRPLRERLERAFRETRADFAVGVGYAPGRAALGIERVAVNVRDFALADIAGVRVKDEPVDPAGPDARLATLPLTAIVEAWDASGVPGYVSDSAGTYLCNQWLYEALAIAGAAGIPTGFVHVPALPQQAIALGADRTPSMPLDLMRRGIEIAIETAVRESDKQPAKPPPPARAGASDWFSRGLTKR